MLFDHFLGSWTLDVLAVARCDATLQQPNTGTEREQLSHSAQATMMREPNLVDVRRERSSRPESKFDAKPEAHCKDNLLEERGVGCFSFVGLWCLW